MPYRVSILVALILAIGTTSAAQHPDQSGYGQALFQPEMPNGTATVKVVGKNVSDGLVGQPVQMHRLVAGGSTEKIGEVKTSDQGRARFEGLKPGATYQAVVPLQKGEVRSAVFTAPKAGGVQFLLATQVAGGVHGDPHAGIAPGAGAPGGAPASSTSGPNGAAELVPVESLPAGTIQIAVVRGKKREPVAGAPVTIRLDGANQTKKTDAQGVLSLQLGAQARGLKVEVSHDAVSYHSDVIAPPKKGGLKVSFLVHDVSADPQILRIGPGSHLLASISERRIGFRQVLNVVNKSDKVFMPPPKGWLLPVPEGAVDIEIPDELKRLINQGADGTLSLTKPVSPGMLSLQYFFEMPYDNTALDVRQTLPAGLDRMMVVIMNNEHVNLIGPTVESKRVETMSGTRAGIFTLRGSDRAEALEFTMVGLPTRSRVWMLGSFAVAGILVLWALFAIVSGGRSEAARRREALLQQVVELDRAKQAGEIEDPTRYERERKKLVKQLTQCWGDQS